ncbi:hypothetical protein QA640_02055 [Bradyrhizobium sp. CB82]|uniref:hypothetical protein n=1 Tax=Bradyrhizobium sp. CB82 TaxID=3039159 RepID=UPI0024B0EFA0|nr:hypothetical protein [Bradyrhizobium sp. CB82]WFU41342.1 hypothetical protein QA640_02055 [Bradyrhizobium sp. CB82]
MNLAKIDTVESVLQRTMDGGRQQHFAASGVICQTRGQVHAFAGDGVGLVTRAPHLTRQDLTACDSYMHANVAAEPLSEHRDRVADSQCREDRSLGIIAMSYRSAEHGHDAVTDVLVDGAAVLNDRSIGNFEECGENALDILSIKQLAQPGISREIRKQHGNLPPLAWSGLVRLFWLRLRIRTRAGTWLVAQERNRVEQATPMSDRGDTKIPEIVGRQIG